MEQNNRQVHRKESKLKKLKSREGKIINEKRNMIVVHGMTQLFDNIGLVTIMKALNIKRIMN